MEILGFIGIILGIITIIWLSIKEVHITIAAPIAALVVILFNGMQIAPSMIGMAPEVKSSFMIALGTYVMKYFIIFMLGSILAKFMEDSGATTAIADYILKKFGSDNPYRVMVAIFIISAILTYGGITLFVVMFAIIPLAYTLFKKLNIAWNLIAVPLWMGIASFTMTILPGTPAIQNVIPIEYLGTSLVAAAIPSFIGAIGTIAFSLWYMKHLLNKSLKAGETFASYPIDVKIVEKEGETPNVAASIAPLATLIVIAILGSYLGNKFWKEDIIYVALVVGILLAAVLYRKYLSNITRTLSIGASGAMAPIFATSSAVAFGAVVLLAPGFSLISKAILGIPGSPLISLTLLTSAMSAITGSSSGALGIVMPGFAHHYLATGLNPQMIHRVAAIASNITTIVPQSGVWLTFLALTGLKTKNSFRQTFTAISIGCIIALVVVIGLGSIMYK